MTQFSTTFPWLLVSCLLSLLSLPVLVLMIAHASSHTHTHTHTHAHAHAHAQTKRPNRPCPGLPGHDSRTAAHTVVPVSIDYFRSLPSGTWWDKRAAYPLSSTPGPEIKFASSLHPVPAAAALPERADKQHTHHPWSRAPLFGPHLGPLITLPARLHQNSTALHRLHSTTQHITAQTQRSTAAPC